MPLKPAAMSRPLLVTTSWDDGHPSDLRVAALLEKHGLTGTFYVPCANSEGRAVMRPAEIAQLGRQFEIGGHTRDHVVLTDLAPLSALSQIVANKRRLEDLLGQEVCGFAYVRGRHDVNVRNLVAKSGYRYARTGKNLMSTPGSDRLRVPTTIQFFAHRSLVRIGNFVRKGPTLQRAAILAALYTAGGLSKRCLRAAEICRHVGGHFHLWGHSWELDEHDLWDELDCLFRQLRELDAHFVTNAEWCASLTKGHQSPAQSAGNRQPDDRAPPPSAAAPATDGGFRRRVVHDGA